MNRLIAEAKRSDQEIGRLRRLFYTTVGAIRIGLVRAVSWMSPGRDGSRRWQRRKVAPSEILKRVRRLELRLRRLVSEMFLGAYESIFKGQGLEFEEVREYQAGDDVRNIDWNVSARMARLFVKKFRHERELRVFLVVDVSPSLEFGSQGIKKSDLSAELAAALILAAVRSNDRVGLVLFTDRVEKFIPPKKGMSQAHRLIREILFCEPAGTGTDLVPALDLLRRFARRKRSIIFILTDLHAKGYEASLKKLAHRHDVLVILLRDRREKSLAPLGLVRLMDLETGEERWLDLRSPSLGERWQQFIEAEWRQREGLLTQWRIDYAEVVPGESPLVPLMELFRKREYRLRSGR
ncbi:MAG: DUF58 domain-containing protein [Armatimonadetes bacterium]|nr:DUF58 domain-containing protein [Armatimonadota bacterium]MDW8122868.1 DUF58 domain-containing protein [Armatimonadota bacterium]